MVARKPTYPPDLTRYREQSYVALVRQRDDDFNRAANKVVEYEMPKPRGGIRKFEGWYKTRGAYGS